MLYLRYYGYELFAIYIEDIDKYTEQKEGYIQVMYQRVRFNLKKFLQVPYNRDVHERNGTTKSMKEFPRFSA